MMILYCGLLSYAIGVTRCWWLR